MPSLKEQPIDDWLIMWRKGVDSTKLLSTLCGGTSRNLGSSLPSISANVLPALNCTAQFTQLLSGFAGE